MSDKSTGTDEAPKPRRLTLRETATWKRVHAEHVEIQRRHAFNSAMLGGAQMRTESPPALEPLANAYADGMAALSASENALATLLKRWDFRHPVVDENDEIVSDQKDDHL